MPGNPVPTAAAVSLPNSRTSVDILWPTQLAAPGVPANGAKTHVAPASPSSQGPPKMAVLPSPDNETEAPCCAGPTAPVPTSLSCWLQTPPERVYNHTAPVSSLSA